jgi:hypothetical protein
MAEDDGDDYVDWFDPASYAFNGDLEFDMVLEFLGRRGTRNAG